MQLKRPLRTALFAISLAACLAPATVRAQGVWNNADDRDYAGNPPVLQTPYWSYGYVPPDASGHNSHVGNWGGVPYPGSGGVTSAILGAPGNTNCNVQVSLNALTINPGGELLMNWSSALTVASTNVATDGTLAFNTAGGGGFPIFNNAGTFRKSAGSGLYSIESEIVFNSLPGSVIQVDSGSLQLAGDQGLFDTVTFNTAAGTTIDLVGDRGQFGENWFQGTLTNTTGVGTVLLRANRMRDNPRGDQKCTLNFAGSVFQWTGGTMGGTNSGEVPIFTNVGTMTLSGAGTKYTEAFINNQGRIVHQDGGNLDIRAVTVTNAAGGTYDLQTDAGIVTTYYGNFANSGLFKKSGGTGTSTITTSFTHLGGTVEVDSGTLQMPTADLNNFTSTGGNFVVAANAVLDLGNSYTFAGTYTGSGAGTVRFASGVLNSDYHGDGQLTINFTGNLFQWLGGTIGSYWPRSFTNSGTMTLAGNDPKAFNYTVTNSGTMVHTGGGDLSLLAYSTLNNTATGVYDLRSDAGFSGGGDDHNHPFTNAGLIQKSGGTGNSTFAAYLVNTGTISALSGTLTLAGTIVQLDGTTLTGGTWNVGNGATLAFSQYPNGLTVNQGTVTLNGASAQFPAINGLVDNQGTFSLLAQRQFTTAGALSNEGTLTLDAGSTLHVSGAYTGSGTSTVAFTVGGTQSQGAGSAGVLQVNGAATLGGTLSVKLGAGVQIKTTDTITILAATGGLNGAFANVPNGERINTADGTGSFQVNYGSGSAFSANAVVLNEFASNGVVAHPAFFTSEAALGNGVYYLSFASGNPFGYYSYLTDPHYIYHFDLGYEYWFDAADGRDGVYFYDFESSDFFYTSPSFPFPYLYDFGLNAVLYYYPDPNNAGHYNTDGVRYFYNFATGQIFSR